MYLVRVNFPVFKKEMCQRVNLWMIVIHVHIECNCSFLSTYRYLFAYLSSRLMKRKYETSDYSCCNQLMININQIHIQNVALIKKYATKGSHLYPLPSLELNYLNWPDLYIVKCQINCTWICKYQYIKIEVLDKIQQ